MMIDGLEEQEFKDYQARVLLHCFLRKLKVIRGPVTSVSLRYLLAVAFDLQSDHNGETILVQRTIP
jgi:hypothetical protein